MIEDENERRKTSKTMMVGIVVQVAVGGIITPVGSSCMILASNYLTAAGYPITFVEWICFGLPVALITFPVSMFVIFKLLPPAEQSAETRAEFLQKVKEQIPEKYSIEEILTIIILTVTFICWIANFNLILVTCCCCIALLFPGFNLLTWKEYNDNTSWGTALLMCSLLVVVSALQNTGVMEFLISLFKSFLPQNASAFIMLIIFGIFTALIMMLCPNGPAMVAVLGPTILSLGETMGIHTAVLLLGFAFFTTFAIILPTESITVMVYEGGANFDAKDVPKVGIPVTITLTLAAAAWLPLCAKILGL